MENLWVYEIYDTYGLLQLIEIDIETSKLQV